MIFSQRFAHSLKKGALKIKISLEIRKRMWRQIDKHNHNFLIQEDPSNSYATNTDVITEVANRLVDEHDWDSLPFRNEFPGEPLYSFVICAPEAELFDAIETVQIFLGASDKQSFQDKINKILEIERSPWRILSGEFFKLDADFVDAKLEVMAYKMLSAGKFAGAAAEYAKAQQELSVGDVKDAIIHAGKSFESVLKVLTSRKTGNASDLISILEISGFLDDLPEDSRGGFKSQVLGALPFLRNKLAGHGQGADVVEIPHAYGVLAVQLAAAFHNFLITKHMQRSEAAMEHPEAGEIPF